MASNNQNLSTAELITVPVQPDQQPSEQQIPEYRTRAGNAQDTTATPGNNTVAILVERINFHKFAVQELEQTGRLLEDLIRLQTNEFNLVTENNRDPTE